MKKIFWALALTGCMTSITGYAQDTTRTLFDGTSKTLINRERIKYIGFYGDFNFQYGQIKNSFTPIGGASAMVLFNKRLGVGATFQRNIGHNFSPSGVSPLYMNSSFGGLKVEYITNPNAAVHLAFPLIVGMGTARVDSGNGYRNPFERISDRFNDDRNDHDYDHNDSKVSRFFVIQPGVQIEANLIKYIKIYAGVNYRFSFVNFNEANLTSNALNGFSAVIGVKAGIFELSTKKKPKLPVDGEESK